MAVCIISKGPVSQHFYWVFGGKFKKTAQTKSQKYQEKYQVKQGGGWILKKLEKKIMRNKLFVFWAKRKGYLHIFRRQVLIPGGIQSNLSPFLS